MPSESVTGVPRPRTFLSFVLAVGVVTACWILGNPRSSGPDEPSHMVTSAALVRGETDGSPNPTDPATRLMTVPSMVGAPDPGCWAFFPDETPACTDDDALRTDTVDVPTTSFNYPPFGLVLPGLASFVPWPEGYAYLARALSALVPVLLVAGALAMLRERGRTLGVAALLGLTPIAWFTFGVVNPSALAIAGGLALATGCLTLPAGDARARLLTLAGWLAVVLPRRDGPLWAAVVVIIASATIDLRPSDLWRQLPRWARVTIAVSALVPLVQVVSRGDSAFNVALAAAVLAIPAYEALLIAWARWPGRDQRVALALSLTVAGAAGFGVVLLTRPGGYDANLLHLVVGNTGDHLVQLVGVLGWLSAPVPMSGVLLFWAALGGLAAVAVIERPRSAVAPVVGLSIAIVLAWVLELGQGSSYGSYWQGRYTMPLAVGLPLLAAWRSRPSNLDQLAVPMAVVSWVVLNLGFFAAQRRWAVGVDGTWYVWNWDTWDAPLPPAALLLAHAASTAWLTTSVVTRRGSPT
jgi:hypothetical protein